MADTNIFETLRESHELQRTLYRQLTETSGDTPERQELFDQLKLELTAHELAEERHFYIPLMQLDPGVDLSRHAIAEHHAIDELVEALQATDASSPGWLPLARKLADKVTHHLHEEEQRFFQMAGKLLTDAQKSTLAGGYVSEYAAAKASLASSAAA